MNNLKQMIKENTQVFYKNYKLVASYEKDAYGLPEKLYYFIDNEPIILSNEDVAQCSFIEPDKKVFINLELVNASNDTLNKIMKLISGELKHTRHSVELVK